MQVRTKHDIYGLVLAAFLALTSAAAESSSFSRRELGEGISVDVPTHWYVLGTDERANLQATGTAVLSAIGEAPESGKKTLLAVNAKPSPTGAMIRVSIKPAEYTQSDLRAFTSHDFAEASQAFVQGMRSAEAHGGPKMLSSESVRLERLGGRHALYIRYRRASALTGDSWTVTQYHIPTSRNTVVFTLSHRERDGAVWRPILDHVKRSLRLPQ